MVDKNVMALYNLIKKIKVNLTKLQKLQIFYPIKHIKQYQIGQENLFSLM